MSRMAVLNSKTLIEKVYKFQPSKMSRRLSVDSLDVRNFESNRRSFSLNNIRSRSIFEDKNYKIPKSARWETIFQCPRFSAKSIRDGRNSPQSSTIYEEELHPWKYPEPVSMHGVFQIGKRLASGKFLGRRLTPDAPYDWLSYDEVSDMADAFGSGVINELNVKPENHPLVGLYSKNRVEWMVTDLACVKFSLVNVPLFDGIRADALEYILNDTKLDVLIVDSIDKIEKLLKMGDKLSHLKSIVLMDEYDKSTNLRKQMSDNFGWNLQSFSELLEIGKKFPRELCPAKPDDVFTIAHTSGTTGNPRGVVITHRAMALNCRAGVQLLETGQFCHLDPTREVKKHKSFSFLPLAHIYERYHMYVFIMSGFEVAFFTGDQSRFLDDMRSAKPTALVVVPQVLNEIYNSIKNETDKSILKTLLLNWAMKIKMRNFELGIMKSDSLWDKLVFQKMQDLAGGNLRIIICGGASLSPQVANFIRLCFNISLVVGYGQTETLISTISRSSNFIIDHVGTPIPGVAIKLIDVPELGYFAEDGYGEILIRSPFIMREYFNQRDETLDKDGWVHTGDIGTWTGDCNLKIVDRRQNVFKLPNGYYVSPEKIESIV